MDLDTDIRRERAIRDYEDRCYRAGEPVFIECETCEGEFQPEDGEAVCAECRSAETDNEHDRCRDDRRAP